MFETLAARIRLLPVWGQAIAWPLYVLARTVASLASWMGNLITRSAEGFFGGVVRGSLMAILAKVAGLMLLAGLLAIGIGADDVGSGLVMLSAAPIMLFGLVYAGKSVLASPRKKKH